jgi:polysaccharide export outer membrane protein
MRVSRLSRLVPAVLALALGGCFARGPQYAQGQYVPPGQAAEYAAASARVPVVYAAPSIPASPAPCGSAGCGGRAAPAYAAYPQPVMQAPYLLDAGDRLRITVFGQDGLTNSYAVDAAGNITVPLVGTLPARGRTTAQLSLALSQRLQQGYIREPKVAIEVEAYRPFFIYGEVANLTAENAIAMAGGFGPRADRSKVTVSRTINGQTTRATVPLSYPLRPGDTLRIDERWF